MLPLEEEMLKLSGMFETSCRLDSEYTIMSWTTAYCRCPFPQDVKSKVSHFELKACSLDDIQKDREYY